MPLVEPSRDPIGAVSVLRRKARSAARRARWHLMRALEPRRTVTARGVRLSLQCENWITQFRLESFASKEPETLDWIDEAMRDGDCLFDIGGNIGVFVVYAALRHPRASVVVFEPEFANLHLLRDNIVANGLADRVRVYPIALSDRSGLSRLHVQDLTPGAALHSESTAALETTESGERVVFIEGAWAMKLDDFCDEAGLWPHVMKVDVDGAEARVLCGAAKTLARPGLRSIMVEVGRSDRWMEARTLLQNFGFHLAEPVRRLDVGNQEWRR